MSFLIGLVIFVCGAAVGVGALALLVDILERMDPEGFYRARREAAREILDEDAQF